MENEKIKILEKVMEGLMEEDIVILDDLHTAPCLNEEYHTQYFYIGLCRSGMLISQYDYKEKVFSANDICWILPDHVLSHQYVSEDYSVLSVFISKPYFRQLKQNGILGRHQYLTGMSSITSSPAIFDIVYNGFQVLQKLLKLEIPNRKDLISPILYMTTKVIDNYIKENIPEIPPKAMQNEKVFDKFYEAVTMHYTESHETAFYARKLSLSPKYFGSIVRETTGISALEWINRYLIVEAKWRLLHETQKSIQQISMELGFSEQSSFCRLFKKIEGVTPSTYRQNGLS